MRIFERFTLEDRFVAVSLVLTMAGILTGALLREPDSFGITALFVTGFLIIAWRWTRSVRLAWLLVFGLVAGILELWADWVHVAYFHSLVYESYFGFRLLASPSYMPAGWWLTVVQFGYIALRLDERWKPAATVGLVTALGMLLPPWYEEFASPAQAWYYPPRSLMLSNTPVWIIFTYGGCMFFIAATALVAYRPGSWSRAALGGLLVGAGILFSGVFWFSMLGS